MDIETSNFQKTCKYKYSEPYDISFQFFRFYVNPQGSAVSICLFFYSQPAARVCVVRYRRKYIQFLWRFGGGGVQGKFSVIFGPNKNLGFGLGPS